MQLFRHLQADVPGHHSRGRQLLHPIPFPKAALPSKTVLPFAEPSIVLAPAVFGFLSASIVKLWEFMCFAWQLPKESQLRCFQDIMRELL